MKAWIYALALLPTIAIADIYKCTDNGKTVFSDTPCGNSAKKITVVTTQPTGAGMATAGMREMSAELGRDRRIAEIDRDIDDLQKNIETYNINRETEIAALRDKKGRADI